MTTITTMAMEAIKCHNRKGRCHGVVVPEFSKTCITIATTSCHNRHLTTKIKESHHLLLLLIDSDQLSWVQFFHHQQSANRRSREFYLLKNWDIDTRLPTSLPYNNTRTNYNFRLNDLTAYHNSQGIACPTHNMQDWIRACNISGCKCTNATCFACCWSEVFLLAQHYLCMCRFCVHTWSSESLMFWLSLWV